jgi:predicted small lipoprotein YifL
MTTVLAPRPRRAAALLALFLALLVLPLAACGKKGAPSPPADEPSTYPRSYPRE